jgi:hypothetical protein
MTFTSCTSQLAQGDARQLIVTDDVSNLAGSP